MFRQHSKWNGYPGWIGNNYCCFPVDFVLAKALTWLAFAVTSDDRRLKNSWFICIWSTACIVLRSFLNLAAHWSKNNFFEYFSSFEYSFQIVFRSMCPRFHLHFFFFVFRPWCVHARVWLILRLMWWVQSTELPVFFPRAQHFLGWLMILLWNFYIVICGCRFLDPGKNIY